MNRRLLLGAIYIVVGFALSRITSQCPTPEKVETLWYALPAFLIFILFLIAIFSLGSIVRKKINLPHFSGVENGLFDLSVGTCLLYVCAYLLTPFHLFSSNTTLLLWILLGLGTTIGFEDIQIGRWFEFTTRKWSKFLLGVPFLIVLLKLLEGLQFPAHGDAYNAYLPAPRSWAELGAFSNYPKSIQYFLSTSWESFSAFGTALMGLHEGQGLDLSQFFAQWCTGGIAVLGVVFASLAFCVRLAEVIPLAPTWFPAISILALQVPCLRWTENLAKNDFGICFWGFSAFYFAEYLVFISPIFAILGGVIAGAMVVGKFTAALLAVALTISTFIRNKKTALLYALGGIFGALPVLARNFSLTQNPFYPWFASLFQSRGLSESAQAGSAQATLVSIQLDQIPAYTVELLKELPFLPFIFLILFCKPISKNIGQSISTLLASLVAFTLLFRPNTEIRYQGPTLVILATLSAFLFFSILESLSKRYLNRFAQAPLLIASILVIALSNISFFTFAQIGGKKFVPWTTRAIELPEIGAPNQLWIRQHLSPNEPLLILGDGYPYYLMDYSISSWGSKEGIEKMIESHQTADLKTILRTAPIHYLYLSSLAGYVPYRQSIQELMDQLLDWKSECNLYATPNSQVWDMTCVNQSAI